MCSTAVVSWFKAWSSITSVFVLLAVLNASGCRSATGHSRLPSGESKAWGDTYEWWFAQIRDNRTALRHAVSNSDQVACVILLGERVDVRRPFRYLDLTPIVVVRHGYPENDRPEVGDRQIVVESDRLVDALCGMREVSGDEMYGASETWYGAVCSATHEVIGCCEFRGEDLRALADDVLCPDARGVDYREAPKQQGLLQIGVTDRTDAVRGSQIETE